MITVKLGHGTDPIKAMQKLKNKLIKEELFIELKKRRFYAKPSLKRRLKKEEAERQRVKDFRKKVRQAQQDEWGKNF
mgnify:CR=1 FL=1